MSLIRFPNSIQPELLTILIHIMTSTDYTQFVLGGGTSLALRFGHRSSVDIDLFSMQPFDSMRLQTCIALDFPNSQIVNRTSGSLCIYTSGIKIDFLNHPFPLLEKTEEDGPHRILSIGDVSAMKINAVTNRGSKKDFIDLYLLHTQGVSLSQALENFSKKYNGNKFLAVRSLLWFDDAEKEPDPIFLNNWTWDVVRDEIQHLADEIILS